MHPSTFANAVWQFVAVDVLLCKSPADILNSLQAILDQHERIGPGPLQTICIWRIPKRYTDWGAYVLNETVFCHERVSPKFWPEYLRLVKLHRSSPTSELTRVRITPFTLTEAMREVDGSQWVVDLLHKHNWHDCIYVPLGLWVVTFGCLARLDHITDADRMTWSSLGGAAACRLEMLLGPPPKRSDNPTRRLAPREIAVLRELSVGHRTAEEIGGFLGITANSVNTDIKRAQKKLGSKSRSHAVAEAMRRGLFD